jgi:hypothetical protein
MDATATNISDGAAAEPLKVHFEMTASDHAAAYWRGLVHPMQRRGTLLMGVALLVYLPISIATGRIAVDLSLLGGVLFLLFGALPLLIHLRGARTPASRGPHAITIDREGIRGHTEGVGEMQWSWAETEPLQTTEAHLLLYLKDRRLMVIPRRAFAGEAAVEEFLAAARRWRQNSDTNG